MSNKRVYVFFVILLISTVCFILFQIKVASAKNSTELISEHHSLTLPARGSLYSQSISLEVIFIPQAKGEDEDGPGSQGYSGTYGPTCTRAANLPPLTVLAPGIGLNHNQATWGAEANIRSSWQLTAESNPAFWFYVPYQFNSSILDIEAEFDLINENTGSQVAKSIYQIIGRPGIISIRLPGGGNYQALSLNTPYHWNFRIICDPEHRDRSPYVSGNVRRVSMSRNYLPETATPDERAVLYAREGLWNETLSTIIDDVYPTDPSRAQILLEQLLSSRYVNLEELSQQPIIDCCESNE